MSPRAKTGGRWPCSVTSSMYSNKRVSPAEKRRRKERSLLKRKEAEVLAAFRAGRLLEFAKVAKLNGVATKVQDSVLNVKKNVVSPAAAKPAGEASRQFSCGDVFDLAFPEIAKIFTGDDAKGKKCGARELYEAYVKWHQDAFLTKHPGHESDQLSDQQLYSCLNHQYGHLKKSHSGKSVFAGMALLLR